MDRHIIIIGAGVSGISTGIVFLLMGYSVKIISKDYPLSRPVIYDFSSLYPAASIIPHSVFSPATNRLFGESLMIYEKMLIHRFSGISEHRHFEIFGFEKEPASYLPLLNNAMVLSANDSNYQLSHPTIATKTGWSFDCYFANWPLYFPSLLKLFHNLGGEIEQALISPDRVAELPSDIVVNCAGLNGPTLIQQQELRTVARGHLLRVTVPKNILNALKKGVSYNFSPGISHYQSESGNVQDVYFYPRENDLILGGSRLLGTIDTKQQWMGDNVLEPTRHIEDQLIPEQIWALNKELISHSFKVDISRFLSIELLTGLRFLGTEKIGLDLNSSSTENKLIVNNYAHGGAGVSLSWGCALECLNAVTKHFGKTEISISELADRLSSTF